MPTTHRCLFLWLAIAAPAWLAGPVWADQWVDTYDTPETTWTAVEGTTRVLRHERIRLTERSPEGEDPSPTIGAEQVVYGCPAGLSAWWWCEVPAAAVIDELRIGTTLRTTQPGTRLVGEVALPRSLDPKTGKPIRLIVQPSTRSFPAAGDLDLSLDGFPRAVARAVRARRIADRSVKIDPNGAFLTRVGLVTSGSSRPASLWIKSLRVEGIVSVSEPSVEDRTTDSPAPVGTLEPTVVTLSSDGFRIDGKSFFPRAWAHHEASFAELSRLGFNTVLLREMPDSATLREAALHSLHLIAPPPTPEAARESEGPWSAVLAWILPDSASPQNLDTLLAQVEDVRALPPIAQRPLLLWAGDAPGEVSRLADGLLVPPLGSRLGQGETTARGLHAAGLASRAGTPLVVAIPCNLGEQAHQQLNAMLDEGAFPAWLPPGDIARATHDALAVGCKGILYTATESLEGLSTETVHTGRWLATSNAELKLIEPWITGPSPPAPLASGGGFLLKRDGVRLALPTPLELDPQASLVLPGAGALTRVARLTPCGLHTLPSRRVVGGLQTDRPGLKNPGWVLASNDPRAAHSLQRYTAKTAHQVARDWLSLAKEALDRSEALDTPTRAAAREELGRASLAMARPDYAAAYDIAHSVIETTELAARARRSVAQQKGKLIESSPLALLPETLTDHFRLMQVLASASRGENRLQGGSFEDIDEIRRQGWRRPTVALANESTQIELSEGSPIHGSRLLRLSSTDPALRGDRGPRIVSPPIELSPGELIEITGWARVTGDEGFLLVADSLGGEELSLSIRSGDPWQPFRLLRRAEELTSLQLTLAVEGAATAEVDGIMARPIVLQQQDPSLANARSRNTTQEK